jgi:hypothetical protein
MIAKHLTLAIMLIVAGGCASTNLHNEYWRPKQMSDVAGVYESIDDINTYSRLYLAVDGTGAFTIDTARMKGESCHGSSIKWKLTDNGEVTIKLTGISEKNVDPHMILNDGHWARSGESRGIFAGGRPPAVADSMNVLWFMIHGPTAFHYVRSQLIQEARGRSSVFIPE